MDTTIKVDSQIRDRLARLAKEHGTSIRDLVADLATSTLTQDELATRAEAATAYVRDRINPRLTDADLAVGEQFWHALEMGGLPNVAALYSTTGENAA